MKILFVIVVSLFGLVLASCVPGGTRPAQGWSGTTFNNGILYVGSVDGKVVAINSSSPSLEWSYAIAAPSEGMSCGRTSAPAAIYGTPIADGDLVYIGSYNGKALALSTLARSQGLSFPQKRDGEWEWDCPKEGKKGNAIVASPVAGEDAIYIASSNGRIYSLDKEFGDLNWKSVVLGEKLWTTPVIEDDAIYVSTFDGHIYALSTSDGSLVWSFEADEGFVSSPVLYKDTIVAGSFGHNLYAIKVGDDEPLWKFSGGNWFWAAPIVSDGVVYAGCLDGKIYAINCRTGEQLWAFDAKSPIVSSPVLAGDLLVIACDSGEVYMLKTHAAAANSRLRNKISIGVSIRSSLCVQGDVVYVRAQDNCLYALDIDRGERSWEFSLAPKEES